MINKWNKNVKLYISARIINKIKISDFISVGTFVWNDFFIFAFGMKSLDFLINFFRDSSFFLVKNAKHFKWAFFAKSTTGHVAYGGNLRAMKI